ncbi:MAG: hypothetical protein KDK25_09860 [Leptospiraceae bacterium]|nr:hypothetical protein [Leptospiraceae bacterium]
MKRHPADSRIFTAGLRYLLAAMPLILSLQILSAQSLVMPPALQRGQSGAHDVVVRYSGFFEAKSGVRIMVYIPTSISRQHLKIRPAIVFFHGNTKQSSYYRDSVGYMTARAEKFKFILVSVQNWWALGSGDLEGADDSRRATNLVMHKLVDLELCDGTRVYTTGFSAGGFTALLTFFNSINEFEDEEFARQYGENMEGASAETAAEHWYRDSGGVRFNTFPYAGFGSFKGNYYESYFQMNPLVENRKQHWKKLLIGKTLFISVGEHDVPRVKQQAPEAAEFFRRYADIEPVFVAYPGEGHVLSDQNWQDFWYLVDK